MRERERESVREKGTKRFVGATAKGRYGLSSNLIALKWGVVAHDSSSSSGGGCCWATLALARAHTLVHTHTHARAHSHAIARACTHASKKLNNPRALFLARASSIFFHLSETFHGFSIERTNGDNFRKTTTRLKPKSSEFERNGSNENLRRT